MQTLKPRLAVQGDRLATHHVERKRGRAGVEDRNRIRQRDYGLCQACLELDIVRVGTQVDHIVPLHKGGPDVDTNKRLLCDACHEVKTLADLGLKHKPLGPMWKWGDRDHRKNEHIQALLHPANLKPSAIPLTIVCGPAGAGKSTYIKANAAPGDTVIDMDIIRTELGIGEDQWTTDNLDKTLERRNALLSGLANAKSGSAWFIVTAATADERTWWQQALQPLRMVLILASPETCIERIKRTRTGIRAERSCNAARSWWQKYSKRDGETEIRTD